MKKVLALLLAAIMVLTMFAGCGEQKPEEVKNETNTSTPAENTSETNTTNETNTTEPTPAAKCTVAEDADIVVLNYSDIATFFPADITQGSEYLPASFAYESLCEFADDGSIRWLLGTGVEASEDGLEYTFTLREGVKFSDGTPWNAEALKKNFDVMLDPNNAFMGVSLFEPVDHCEVVDEYTAKIILKETYAPFLNVIASYCGFVSPSLLEKGSEAWKNEVCGTGQYTLTEYQSGDHMTYTLNREYWGYDAELCGGTAMVEPNMGFNTITLRPVAEEATRMAMLMSGEADVINSISATNVPTVEGAGNTIITNLGGMVGYMYYNCQKGPLKDPAVRWALTTAIDAATLNDVVYGGMNNTCDSIIPPAISYYKSEGGWEFNVEKAKQMLTDAGYPDGFKLVAWEENDTTDIQRGQFIQQCLAKIGVEVEVLPKEGGLLATEVGAFDGNPEEQGYDLYIRGYGTDTYDPDEMLGRFTTPRWTPVGSNYSYYSNEKVDELCAAGAKTTDSAARKKAYEEVQDILWEEMPAVPLLVNGWVGAYGEHVQNLDYSMTSMLYFKTASYK